jgi:hypothetical protein
MTHVPGPPPIFNLSLSELVFKISSKEIWEDGGQPKLSDPIRLDDFSISGIVLTDVRPNGTKT